MKIMFSPNRLLFLLTMLLVTPRAMGAVDLFLTLGEKIKGETQDKEFKPKGAIDITSWSWSMSQSGSTHFGGGGGAGKANFQDLSFTKYLDTASTVLMTYLASGTRIPEAVLIVRKVGENPKHWLEITLRDVIVSSISTGALSSDNRLTENVALNFAKVKVEYFVTDAKGITKSGGIFSWDIASNAKP